VVHHGSVMCGNTCWFLFHKSVFTPLRVCSIGGVCVSLTFEFETLVLIGNYLDTTSVLVAKVVDCMFGSCKERVWVIWCLGMCPMENNHGD
jgi:hypothetical protein